MTWLLHWFAVHTGTDAPGDHWYNFWSGFGSDIGEATVIVAMVGAARHMNCHTKGCLRIGRYQVEGTPYKVCSHCHPVVPNKPPTKEQVHAAHRAAQRKEAA